MLRARPDLPPLDDEGDFPAGHVQTYRFDLTGESSNAALRMTRLYYWVPERLRIMGSKVVEGAGRVVPRHASRRHVRSDHGVHLQATLAAETRQSLKEYFDRRIKLAEEMPGASRRRMGGFSVSSSC